jgi:hypothetical protein
VHRIDHATRAIDGNGTGKDGFTGGSVSTQVPATVVTADIMNALQEEPANVIEAYVGPLVKADNTQLRQVVDALVTGIIEGVASADALTATGLANRGAAASSVLRDAASDDNLTIVAAFQASANQIRSSTDGGATFTARTLGSASAESIYGVAWSPTLSLFVCVGTTGEIQSSPDGTTWTRRTPGSGSTANFEDVIWSPSHGKFVAVGNDGEVQTSSNGTTWTRLSSSVGRFYQSVAANGSRVMAIAVNGDIFLSDDLTTFEIVAGGYTALGFGSISRKQLGVAGGFFVALASSGTAVSTLVTVTGKRWLVLRTDNGIASSTGYTVSEHSGVVTRPSSDGFEVCSSAAGAGSKFRKARPIVGSTGTIMIRTRLAWVAQLSANTLYCSAVSV